MQKLLASNVLLERVGDVILRDTFKEEEEMCASDRHRPKKEVHYTVRINLARTHNPNCAVYKEVIHDE